MDSEFVNWLITGALGPALVGLPVSWSAGKLGRLARGWLDRIRREDGLSRLVLAADPLVKLGGRELAAVRHLLEDPHTWQMIAGGPVGDLTAAITQCLADVIPEQDAIDAARVIARGLLEFAVSDVEPEVFQRVLMARIARLETGQAARLDQAMLQLQADLAAWLACQSQTEEDRAGRILDQLAVVLDRLPPGPASREDVCVYLAVLFRSLNSDSWPQDPRLSGQMLTPSDIERELSIGRADGVEGWDLDDGDIGADDLAERCTRLVILGGPGSGKTWLARRTARRRAAAALSALASGAGLDEVELPLFTTCSMLASRYNASLGIRDAVVSSALNQAGDLGSLRIVEALRVFFSDRNSPVLLVIDSLDEARDPDQVLQQAGMLPWRIILTSRPSSWKRQLMIDPGEGSQKAGELRPLRYPEDVEPLIVSWFASDPARGDAVISQIAARQDLQDAASVPLIAAFLCIIGGDAQLPATRHEIYALVTWQLLWGLWHRSGSEDFDVAGCAGVLREWAWAGAAKDEVTGIGAWPDSIRTPYRQLRRAELTAVNHVAVPVGLPSLALGLTPRRFIHRAIREHLTAEYVAFQMTADQAAAELVSHVWYDPDWEYAGPVALAMHPERDEVLKKLIRLAASPLNGDAGLERIDSCWELRSFFTRVARESKQDSWTTECANVIGRALVDLAGEDLRRLPVAQDWPAASREIRRSILGALDSAGTQDAQALVGALAKLDPGENDLTQARTRLLDLLDTADAGVARWLADVLAGLNPEPDDLVRARGRISDLLTETDNFGYIRQLADALGELGPEPSELARPRDRILDLLDHQVADGLTRLTVPLLVDALTKLQPEANDLSRARDRVRSLLEKDPSLAASVTGLQWEASDLARARSRLLHQLDLASPSNSEGLAETLARLALDTGELTRARSRMLNLLDAAEPHDVPGLVNALACLDPEAAGLAKRHARNRVLDLLDVAGLFSGVPTLAEMLILLDPEPGDLARACTRVIDLLNTANAQFLTRVLAALHPETVALTRARAKVLDFLDDPTAPWAVWALTDILTEMVPEAGDLARARARLLDLLDTNTPGEASLTAGRLIKLAPEPGELARARARVLDLLEASEPLATDYYLAEALAELAGFLAELAPEAGDLARARARVLHRLSTADPAGTAKLGEALIRLAPEANDLAQVLDLLDQARSQDAESLVGTLLRLNPQAGDLARARRRVLTFFDTANDLSIQELVDTLAKLNPPASDLAQARSRALVLFEAANPWDIEGLALALKGLSSQADDLTGARAWVLSLLGQVQPHHARTLITVLTELRPTANDLLGWSSWSVAPDHELLAATRRNSPIESWLKLLATLDGLRLSAGDWTSGDQ
ncbi:NACHT domain-containing protein [Trebonia sp.]|uniref:NACHT domain-containing protein n=1 Tax=Trebonia sp. TaxID=2767075 RepID=UPI00262DE36C|nr:NACHT domain-containing protein [Trebonia sp.]